MLWLPTLGAFASHTTVAANERQGAAKGEGCDYFAMYNMKDPPKKMLSCAGSGGGVWGVWHTQKMCFNFYIASRERKLYKKNYHHVYITKPPTANWFPHMYMCTIHFIFESQYGEKLHHKHGNSREKKEWQGWNICESIFKSAFSFFLIFIEIWIYFKKIKITKIILNFVKISRIWTWIVLN